MYTLEQIEGKRVRIISGENCRTEKIKGCKYRIFHRSQLQDGVMHDFNVKLQRGFVHLDNFVLQIDVHADNIIQIIDNHKEYPHDMKFQLNDRVKSLDKMLYYELLGTITDYFQGINYTK
jgi:hypothetical protein